MYLYSYLVADIALILIWLALFLWRKDVRNVMVFLSVLFGIAGVVVEYIYTIDWWRPLTITHTRIGIEDLVLPNQKVKSRGYVYLTEKVK